MNIPAELRYTKSHEWSRREGNRITVGISDHAQHEITDVVHVELPAVGRTVSQGQPCAVVESVKAAFDIYAPVSGTVVAMNDKLSSNPELVNQAPYGDGYFFVIEATDPAQFDALLSAADYQKTLSAGH